MGWYRDRIHQLEVALLRYGQHERHCGYLGSPCDQMGAPDITQECTCGLSKLMKEFEKNGPGEVRQ